MNFLFSPDGIVVSFLTKIMNVFILGLIWLIFCIPIFTIGASTSAFYSVMFKVSEDNEGYLLKQFLKAFKRDFKQATIVFIINCAIFTLLYLDFFVCINFFKGTYQAVSFVIFFIILLLYFTVACYLFPVISKFENKTKNIFVNSTKLAFGNVIFSVNIVFLSILPVITLYLLRDNFILTTIFWAFIIYIFSVFLKSLLFIKIFKKYNLV